MKKWFYEIYSTFLADRAVCVVIQYCMKSFLSKTFNIADIKHLFWSIHFTSNLKSFGEKNLDLDLLYTL